MLGQKFPQQTLVRAARRIVWHRDCGAGNPSAQHSTRFGRKNTARTGERRTPSA
jgi:hypothetical protein